MILKSAIFHIIGTQRDNIKTHDTGLKRQTTHSLPDLSSHALIVSGIRRCGKSTLLYQLLKERYPDALYLNFEDPRLYGFELKDFSRLDEIITETKSNVLLFDEIQIIDEWERYIRQKLDEEYKLVITGSNATLLGRELGTKLTGRHITKELFPFSYHEFCIFLNLSPSKDSLEDYMKKGGFPEYIKRGEDEILNHLFEDILIRDIAVRHGIRDIKTLKRLALYLVSNVGKPITGNQLKKVFEVGATSTIMEYLSFLEDTYLLHFIPRYSHSIRKQIVNPRKVYAIDTGLVQVNSQSFSDDQGRKLENLVFLHLRRKHKDIYYFLEKGECDFVVSHKGAIVDAIQVCYELTPDNLDRELNAIFEALEFFKLNEGTIITFNQEDHFEKEDRKVRVVPCFEYMRN